MDQAWLDSLSEDWPNESPSPISNSNTKPSRSDPNSARNSISRIPLPTSRRSSIQDSSALPLGERSASNNNISSKIGSRQQSSLRNEFGRGRKLSRTLSGSTTSTTQHNTIQKKSLSSSPKKNSLSQNTPEWKRRLLHGDVAYGEQCDLFSPSGLEKLFSRPPTQDSAVTKENNMPEPAMTFPSSPPSYLPARSQQAREGAGKNGAWMDEDENSMAIGEESMVKPQPASSRRGPKSMTYRMVDTLNSQDFSENDLSQGSNFLLDRALQTSRQQQREDISQDSGLRISERSNSRGGLRVRERSNSLPGRIPSGQSNQSNTTRDEGLTPIYLNAYRGTTGNLEYTLDLAINAEELDSRLRAYDDNTSKQADSPDNSGLIQAETRDTTEDFAHNGKFVSIGRGGRSAEGSFRRRPLSPSSLHPIDEMGSSREVSPNIATPEIPKIRMVQPSSIQGADEASDLSPIPQSSRSPSPNRGDGTKTSSGHSQLKLFGSHNTFTSKKLLRRLSQFEETFHESGEISDGEFTEPNSKAERKHDESIADDELVEGSSKAQSTSPTKKPKRISNFGEGELDNYDFSDGNSAASEANSWRRRISGYKWNGNGKQIEPRQRKENVFGGSDSENSSRPTSSSSAESKSSSQKEILDTPRKPKNGDGEGKRLRHSPLKDPTPKRRRTLMPAEFKDASSAKDEHEYIHGMSRKRKDSRHQDDQQSADPNVIATRQILKPRSASRGNFSPEVGRRPNSQSSDLTNEERRELKEQTKKLAKIQAELDGDAKPLKLLGHFPHLQGNRKPSITTQDYLDDAKKIMAAIREKAKAKPRSANPSNDSSSEHGQMLSESYEDAYEDSDQESTPEAFERPPSREGNRPVPRMPHKQDNPDIIRHLKKYQEDDGVEDVIASSMKQLSLARAAAKTAKDVERSASATITRIVAARISVLPDVVESDPPNIWISASSELQQKRKHESNNDGQDDMGGSQGSIVSSLPSGSSRGSERRVIAPEKINHLIPEQVAGMVFDRQRNIWIKQKISNMESKSVAEDTEEDPFGDIPDLSVDETQEMRTVAARKREELKSDPMHAVEEVLALEEAPNLGRDVSRVDFEEISAEQFSRAQNYRVISMTGRAIGSETPQRAFGVEEDESVLTNPYDSPEPHPVNVAVHFQKQHSGYDTFQRVTGMIAEMRAKAVENTVPPSPRKQDLASDDGYSTPKAPRNTTIQFSSPIASIIKDVSFNTSFNSDWGNDSQMIQDSVMNNRSRNSTPSQSRPTSARKSSLKVRSAFHHASRGVPSTSNGTFPIRQVSTINEQDEDSVMMHTDPKASQRSLSLVNQPSPVVSPSPISNHLQVSKAMTPGKDHLDIGLDASLNLSPMSEFTIHRTDETFALDVSYIGQRRHHEPSTKSKTLSVSVNQLVEKLTDLEPYEPYWEDMKQLDLHNKSLSSLHMLDEFCGTLVELDVSNNKIDQLDGVPPTVRHFKIPHNSISDLSSWGHLTNLQYVDVSNNDLTSLRGFKHLVHLRSLRADNNSITSLDGVKDLDGLLSLRLRGNQLESVDFMDTALKRLTDLDLQGNGLTNIYNIHDLQSLTVLNLEENDLEIFPSPPQDMFFSLKYLKLSGNKISRLNVSRYPNLRLLYLDRNCLGKISGLYKTKYLDSLSMREQRDGSVLDMAFLNEVYEIRKLFLSGNLLPSFDLRVDFLNLQFLELANCGLQNLPSKFGQMMANIRVLNLNFNALKDLTPLLGIVRLKKLHLAGNRLSKLKMTAGILSQFMGLSKLDIRNNPVTLGFYPTALEKRMIFSSQEDEDEAGENEAGDVIDKEPFTLGMADKGLDDRYKARLDLETRLLRRVYEMWMVDGCSRLKLLDGLVADRKVLNVRDATWEALVKAGVLRDSTESDKNSVQESEDEDGPWRNEESRVFYNEEEEKNGQDDSMDVNATSIRNNDNDVVGNTSAIMRDCDTPRPSIERDDDDMTDSTIVKFSSNENEEDYESEAELRANDVDDDDNEGHEYEKEGKSSSIWGAEDSFA